MFYYPRVVFTFKMEKKTFLVADCLTDDHFNARRGSTVGHVVKQQC